MIRTSNDGLDGLIILKVEDTLGLETPKLLMYEDKESNNLRRKPRSELGMKKISFNGVNIVKHTDNRISIAQEDKVSNIGIPKTQAELSRKLSLDKYVGVNKITDVCSAIKLITLSNKPSTLDDFKSFAKTTKLLHKTMQKGLYFVPLDL